MNSFEDSYSEQEAHEILRRAATIQTSGGMSRTELVRAAVEAGISESAIQAAEEQVRMERLEIELRREFIELQRKEFYSSIQGFLVYVAMAAFLFWRSESWLWVSAIIALCASNAVVKHASLAFNTRSASWKQKFETWKGRELRKRDSKAAERADDLITSILGYVPADSKLNVIKELRERGGLELKEAKDFVDDYYQRHPEVLQNRA